MGRSGAGKRRVGGRPVDRSEERGVSRLQSLPQAWLAASTGVGSLRRPGRVQSFSGR